jgi:hypothetical protein
MRHRTDMAREGGSPTFACSVDERRSQDSALRDWIGGRRRGSAYGLLVRHGWLLDIN